MIERVVMMAVLFIVVFAVPASALTPGERIRDCRYCPDMVVVPAGEFQMGTPVGAPIDNATGESPPVMMTIPTAFLIGRFEVTRGEYDVFVRDSGYDARGTCRVWNSSSARYEDVADLSWRQPGVPANPDQNDPVTCISWHDAQRYVAWLSERTEKPYRLPSEAEWEYAARAGSRAMYPWGDNPNGGCTYANIYDLETRRRWPQAWDHAACSDGNSDIAPAGDLEPNAFGLYDMIGNVSEWVEDCATRSHIGRPKDGRAWVWQGGCERIVQRGGGWFSSVDRARPGYRGDADPNARSDFAGFRVVRDLLAEEKE